MKNITVYHNQESRFMPYEDGHLLVAVTSHWLEPFAGTTALAIADWAYATFNADLDTLEHGRATVGGEVTFLAACVYRLLGRRSLSVGDVLEVQDGSASDWLACEPFGWRPIPRPSRVAGQPLSADTVYQHIVQHRRQP